METKELLAERAKLWDDLYKGIIPKRVPIDFYLAGEVYAENAGLSIGRTLWTLDGFEEAMLSMASHLKADCLPKEGGRIPLFSVLSGSRGVVMGSGGFMQHPEISCMEPEEYDEYIASPYDFIAEKIIPRLLAEMGVSGARAYGAFYMAMKAREQQAAKYGQIFSRVSEKLGYYAIPGKYLSRASAPMDILSDYPRGFSGVSKDLKRCPEKVGEAAMAALSMLVKSATPAESSHLGSAGMPCHMPTYMRMKEFEKYYYPSFSKLIHATAEIGQAFRIFCEDDWSRYLDHLQDLPQGTRLMVEKGDPKLWKDKIGDKMILTGFYPTFLLRSGTKDQCVDKAKELIDILAPGGNYFFGFDKTIISRSSIIPENLYAVIDYVAENAYYDNAGEKAWKQDTEETIHKCRDSIPKFEAKNYISAEKRDATPYILPDCHDLMVQQATAYEDMLFKTIIGCI